MEIGVIGGVLIDGLFQLFELYSLAVIVDGLFAITLVAVSVMRGTLEGEMVEDMLSGLRRIVTANDGDGKSHIMIDGGPADEFRTGDLGGLLEIWHGRLNQQLTTTTKR